MKRVLQIAALYLAVGVVSVVVYSCCTKVHQIIGLQFVEVYHTDTIYPRLTDTVYGEIIIEVFADVANAGYMDMQGFMNSAYATSCEYEYINEFKPGTLRWTCNEPFTLNGNIIAAGQNIPIPEEVRIYDGYNFAPGFSFKVTQDFLDTAVFQRDWHTFTLHIETTDGRDFETSVKLFMHL